MTRFMSLLALVAWAGPLAALDVPVSSGEHGNFTRLSLRFPSSIDWTIGRSETGYGLSIDSPEAEFRLGAVFDRIGRDRIAALSQTGPGLLRIDLGCDCHLVAFRFREEWLVLDVRDGPAEAGSPFEDPLAVDAVDQVRSTPETASPSLRLPVVFDHTVLPATIELQSAAPAEGQGRSVDALPEGETADPVAHLLDALSDPLSREPALTEASDGAEAALAETIARAVSQGLLSPSETADRPDVNVGQPTPLPVSEDQTGAHPDAGDGDRSAPEIADHIQEVTDPADEVVWPGIAAETSIDRERPVALGTPGTIEDRGGCLPDAYFAIKDWGDDRDFPAQVAERRAALTAEFDMVPEGAPLALARTYIFFGFGREAKRALEVDGVGSQERSVLLALSALVDGEAAPFPILETQLDCDGPAAMWALLSVMGRTHGKPLDTNAIRRAFRNLPVHLQGHIGNRLSEALVLAGEVEVARLILERSEQAITGASPHADLARAEIAIADHDPGGARAALDDAIHTDIRMPPEAILRLFELAHSDGAPVEDSLFLLAEAYRFENRGSRLAVDLAVAEFRARLDLGQFDVGLGLIDGISQDVPAGELRALMSEAALALTKDGTDLEFLRLSLSRLSSGLSTEAEHALARRLLDLGFPDRARNLLLSEADRNLAEDRRYLRAESAIALERPEDALDELSGMSGEQAARLRTRALAAMGDYGAALSAGAALPETDDRTEAAWRAGAWAQLEGSDDSVLRDAAADMTSASETPPPGLPSIAAGRDALTASEASRGMIERLLQRFPTEPGSGS